MKENRAKIFDEIRADVNTRLIFKDVTSNLLKSRNHTLHVWDATALPTSSHYVPIFLDIIEKFESSGKISPDKHVLVETTTGNAGAAIAYLAKRLGYKLIVFMPADMPLARIEDVRKRMPEDDGISQLRLTEAKQYVRGMVNAFQDFYGSNKRDYHGYRLFAVDHSRRKEALATMGNITEKMIAKLPDNRSIDEVVLALGNGTTATGIGRAIKNNFTRARLTGVEPLESPWVFVKKFGFNQFLTDQGVKAEFHQHKMFGTGGWGVDFPHLDVELIDDVRLVSENSWLSAQIELNLLGHHVGHSSCSCVSIINQLSMLNEHKQLNFFSMFYDPITKY